MVNKEEMKEAIAALERKLRDEFEKKLSNMKDEVQKTYEGKITSLEKTISDLTRRLDNVDTGTVKEAWNIVASKKVAKSQSQIDIINTVSNENKEIERRQKNVIIFGIKESKKTDVAEKKRDDENEIELLLNEVHMDKSVVSRSFRLKSKKGISPIIVEFNYKEERNNFIKKSYRKFEHIYVNPDLTEAQRNLDKQLREKCRELNKPLNLKDDWDNVKSYYVIRNNQVVKINK